MDARLRPRAVVGIALSWVLYFIAAMFVGTISILLWITSIEMSTKREAVLDRELKLQGLANLLCAALGGYVSCLTQHPLAAEFRVGQEQPRIWPDDCGHVRGGRFRQLLNFSATCPNACSAGCW